MAAKVSIEVSVDDKGVVTGLENVRSGIKKVGEEGNLVFTELTNSQAMARKESEALAGSMNTAVTPSLRNARGEAALLGEEFGIKLPRHVRSFIAETSLIGPLMSAAFSATALIFIGQVFLENTQRIKDMASTLGGFTQGLRDMEKAAHDANIELFSNFKDNKLGQTYLASTNQQIEQLGKRRDALMNSLSNTNLVVGTLGAGLGGGALLAVEINKRRELTDVTEKLAAAELLRRNQITQITNNDIDAANAAKTHTKVLKEETDQLLSLIEAMERQHQASGLTGAAKVQDDEAQRIAELRRLGATEGAARELAEREANDKIIELRKQYHDKVRSVEDQAAQSGLSARDRSIEQEHERVDAALADYNREFGALDDLDKNKIAAQKDLEQQLYAIHKLGSDERTKIDTDEAQKAADAAKRAADEAQKTAEKMMKEHQQAVEKMGAELQSLFDDITSGKIGQRLLKNFEKLIFQMVAQWLMGMNQMKSGIGGLFSALLGIGGGKSGTGGFNLGSLFGLGGSSSGGGGGAAVGTGSGVNSSFINSLGLGGAKGGGLSLAGLGGLAMGAATLGVGMFLGSALGDILSPTPADRPKSLIAADVTNGANAETQKIMSDLAGHKIFPEMALEQLAQIQWAENAKLMMLGMPNPNAAAQAKAMHDQILQAQLEEKRAGLRGFQFGAAQFHDGGFTGNAGFRLASNEIKAVLRDDEFVVNPSATKLHRGTLERMNAGWSPMGEMHIHVHALDSADVESAMRRGLAAKILKALNHHVSEGGTGA